MSRYIKSNTRLTVKFLDGDDTSKLLFEVNDRNHMNVGEMFSDTYVTSLINQTIKKENLPENVIVIVTSNYYKV